MDEDKSTRENGQQRSDNQYPVQGNKKKRADLASRENGKKPIEDYKQEIRDRMYKFYVMLLKQDKCIQKLARNNISRPQMLFNERELTGLNQMNIKSKRVVDNIFKIFQQLTSNQDDGTVGAIDEISGERGSNHRSREFDNPDYLDEEWIRNNDGKTEARVRDIGDESVIYGNARDESRRSGDQLKNKKGSRDTARSVPLAIPGTSGLQLSCPKLDRSTDAGKRTRDEFSTSSTSRSTSPVPVKRRADVSSSRESSSSPVIAKRSHFARKIAKSADSTSPNAAAAEGNVAARSVDEGMKTNEVTHQRKMSIARFYEAARHVVPNYFTRLFLDEKTTYVKIDNPILYVLEYMIDGRALYTNLDGTSRKMPRIFERGLRDLGVPPFHMNFYAKRGKTLGRFVLPIASSLSDFDRKRVIQALNRSYEIKCFEPCSNVDSHNELRCAMLESDVLINYNNRLFLVTRGMTAVFGICGYEPLVRGRIAYRLCARDDRGNLVRCGSVLRTDDHPLHVPPNASLQEPCTYGNVWRSVRVSFRDFDGNRLIDTKLCVLPDSPDPIIRLSEIHPIMNDIFDNNRKYIGAKN